MSQFLFATCQVGAEKLLKDEVVREHPELRPAYGRPGIVTFKREAGFVPDFRLHSTFARAYGVSYGRISVQAVSEAGVKALLPPGTEAKTIHIFARDTAEPGEQPEKSELHAVAEAVAEKLTRGSWPETLAHGRALVVDVIVVESDACLIGLHVHGTGRSPFPGGRPPLVLPKNAPSRAYLKLQEALLVFDFLPTPGETAVELGSSPGGAAFALLEQGMHVVGIDPAPADDRLFTRLFAGGEGQSATYKHIQKPFAQVSRSELPPQVDWLLADINEAPEVTIGAAEKFVRMLKPPPQKLILTLKLTQPRFASEIPAYVSRLRKLGYTRLSCRQLSFGRREVVLAAAF